MCHHFVISGKQDKIAFGHKEDLPEDECQRLFNIYMPENVKTNKMYQKLFVG